MNENENMVWVAYHDDFSELAIFSEEIDALRYAVEHTCDVAQVEEGHGVRGQLREQYAARMVEPRAGS